MYVLYKIVPYQKWPCNIVIIWSKIPYHNSVEKENVYSHLKNISWKLLLDSVVNKTSCFHEIFEKMWEINTCYFDNCRASKLWSGYICAIFSKGPNYSQNYFWGFQSLNWFHVKYHWHIIQFSHCVRMTFRRLYCRNFLSCCIWLSSSLEICHLKRKIQTLHL